MFVLSKLYLLAATPGNLLVLLLLAGTVLLFLPARRARAIGRALVALAALAALVITATPLPDALLAPLEDRFPPPAALPQRIDGIIVLGGAVDEVVSAARGQVSLTAAAARLTATVALARRYPEAPILLSGGSGRLAPGPLSEAAVGERFFTEMGVAAERLRLEERSRNTYENAVRSKAMVGPQPGQRWLLVTSAAHMPRAVGVFRAEGWEVIPYPVDYRTTGTGRDSRLFGFADSLDLVDIAAREWMGLLAYRLLGRTKSLFPGP